MANEKPWQVFVLFRGLDRHDGDRLLEAAGYNSRLSHHATEDEARAEAERKVRKLMGVDRSVECVAYYAEPFTDTNRRAEGVPIPVRSRDLREADG